MQVSFRALEYQSDETVRSAEYRFDGDESTGWEVQVDGRPRLQLGPGYRLLQSDRCGVCSTDLARAYLPFPLPQVTGHEVVATDSAGQRYAVEINASHSARRLEHSCEFCRVGLANHCPERLVLGIHDLPGGFGPHILAPVDALHPLSKDIDSDTGTLIEPLAAALHGVTTVRPQTGQRVTVLGPRKLGMLTVAALAAYRSDRDIDFRIAAVSRRHDLLELARRLGADSTRTSGETLESSDIVIDTTGKPDGLETAIGLARAEVHLKSTHGRPAAGLANLTALVVDELNLRPFESLPLGGVIAWLCDQPAPPGLEVVRGTSAEILAQLEARPGLGRADAVVVDSPAGIDAAIRPVEGREVSLVRPRASIYLANGHWDGSSLCRAIVGRGLRLSSSRCGDFAEAIRLIESSAPLRQLASQMVTHRFDSSQLELALATARTPQCIKAIVEHKR